MIAQYLQLPPMTFPASFATTKNSRAGFDMRPPFDAADAEDDRVKGRETDTPDATTDAPPPAGGVARASLSRTDTGVASTLVSRLAKNAGCTGFPTSRCLGGAQWIAGATHR
jgi:hypothetical protein